MSKSNNFITFIVLVMLLFSISCAYQKEKPKTLIIKQKTLVFQKKSFLTLSGLIGDYRLRKDHEF